MYSRCEECGKQSFKNAQEAYRVLGIIGSKGRRRREKKRKDDFGANKPYECPYNPGTWHHGHETPDRRRKPR